MDVFTLTDSHTIDGCLELLDRHPDADDILVSEEVEAFDPITGVRPHVLLYGLDERDPWSRVGGVAVIALVAAVASLGPARRAARVDAAVALRTE